MVRAHAIASSTTFPNVSVVAGKTNTSAEAKNWESASPRSAPAAGWWDGLSPQEQRVLTLLAEGKTNKEIAAALQLSPKTVKNYLSSVYHKLQITRRTQAAALFAKHSRP